MTRADKRARQKERSRQAKEAREAAQKREQRKSMALRFGVSAVIVAVLIGITVLVTNNGKKDDNSSASNTTTTTGAALPAGCTDAAPKENPDRPTFKAAPPLTIDTAKTYTATMSTSCGDITIVLDAKTAPQTVNSFVFLARQGFYDGLSFHRVAKDFVVQGGDSKGDGTGGPGYTLPDEPPTDGYKAGSVAMANSGPNTTGSQFFLTWTDQGAKGLGGPPYAYSSLGTVTKGLDVVEKLGSDYNPNENPADPSTQTPRVPIYITKVEITES